MDTERQVPPSVPYRVRLPADLCGSLAFLSETSGVPQAALVRRWVRDGLARELAGGEPALAG